MLAALPAGLLAFASYPTITAFTLATLAGAVAGAALQRRYPAVLARLTPDRVPVSDRGNSETASR